jgi:hypothetical protein
VSHAGELLVTLRQRIALGVVLPVALLVAALLPLWLYHERLPDSLAAGWNWHGQPTSAYPMAVQVLFIALFSAIPGGRIFWLAFQPSAARGEISASIGVAAFAAGAAVAVSWLIVGANLDAPDWKHAHFQTMNLILLSIVVIAALGAAAGRLGRALETAPQPVEIKLPSAGLAPGARAYWVGTTRVAGTLPLAIMISVMALMSLSTGSGLGPIHVVVGVNLLLFSGIRVTVDRNGVRIVYGLLGWPVQRVHLAQIRHASALEVKRIPFGGWSYQGSLRLLRRAAVVPRNGQGIRLELDGDRTLDIALDDAEQAAGVINDLVAANGGAASKAP